MTLANKITAARFLLSLFVFAAIVLAGRGLPAPWTTAAWWTAMVLFTVTAATDALDGWAARRYGEETSLGRIADPLVDKIVVCGSLILLLGSPAAASVCPPWLIVVVIAREFLIQGLRGAAEGKRIAFPANFWGKQKMIVQSISTVAVMLYAAHFDGVTWAWWAAHGFAWALLMSTIASGLTYAPLARRVLRQESDAPDPAPSED